MMDMPRSDGGDVHYSPLIIDDKEENIYGDRAISDYIRGNSLFQLLEANRIKEGIRDREMDMWNY